MRIIINASKEKFKKNTFGGYYKQRVFPFLYPNKKKGKILREKKKTSIKRFIDNFHANRKREKNYVDSTALERKTA